MNSRSRTSRARIDWDAVERDYRIGDLTDTELARRHSIDKATLSRKIKADRTKETTRWQRDLTEVVRQATNARLMAETVNSAVNARQQKVNDAVKANAEMRTQVILGHRQRAQRAGEVLMRMLDELDATTLKADELEALYARMSGADEEANPTVKRALMQRFGDFMRLHSRVASAQKLMAALKDAQVLEAQAFGGLYDHKGDDGAERTMTELELASRLAYYVDLGRRRQSASGVA